MKRTKLYTILMLVIALGPMAAGCYWNVEISESEVGLIMPDGVKVEKIVGPGRWSDMSSRWADIVQIDIASKTNIWTDNDVATKDKQQIGIEIGVTYRRGPTTDAVLYMWQTYKSEAVSDDALWLQIQNRIARVLKNITTRYSLDQLVGVSDDDVTRASVGMILFDELATELEEVGVTLVDVGINNISTSDSYRARLEDKSDAAAQAEIAKQRTIQAQEKLKQTMAETEVSLELARRARLIAEEEAKVIEQSDRAYELQRIEAMAKMLGAQDKIYFIPDGTDITMFFGNPVTAK